MYKWFRFKQRVMVEKKTFVKINSNKNKMVECLLHKYVHVLLKINHNIVHFGFVVSCNILLG